MSDFLKQDNWQIEELPVLAGYFSWQQSFIVTKKPVYFIRCTKCDKYIWNKDTSCYCGYIISEELINRIYFLNRLMSL